MSARNITWLASYPKSGNTWFRAVLSNLQSRKTVPVAINDLRFGVISAADKARFTQDLGIDPSDFSLDDRDELRAQLFSYWSTNSKDRLFVKTHDVLRSLPNGAPLISGQVTHSALYFVRNPLDIVASFANHQVWTMDDTIAFMIDKAAIFADDHVRGHIQVPQFFSSWSHHVQSWVDSEDVNVLCVRYEDMYANPELTFAKALTHIDVDFDASSLKHALRNSSFDVLSKQEKNTGFYEKKPTSKQFFRKGCLGGWREELNAQQVARITQGCSVMMQKFGYADDNISRETLR